MLLYDDDACLQALWAASKRSDLISQKWRLTDVLCQELTDACVAKTPAVPKVRCCHSCKRGGLGVKVLARSVCAAYVQRMCWANCKSQINILASRKQPRVFFAKRSTVGD